MWESHAVDEYLILNRANWDERAPAHAASPDYPYQAMRTDPERLSDVVRFDLPRLGDVRGLRGVHLQCHIGTDTLSLARLGAAMTGLDFSVPAIEAARALAAETGAAPAAGAAPEPGQADFVVSDLYGAADELGSGGYDLVFTGIGALCWLPDIARWAGVVADLLRPGGRLFLREGHPMLWALDDLRKDGLLVVDYPYFERAEPLVWDAEGTYVTTDVEFATTRTHQWNHGLGEIVTALLDRGMELTMLVEHSSVPWEALPGHMRPAAYGEFELVDRPERVPLTYTLQARKRP
jgi:SAM-dependent methyltransferase